MIFKDIYYNVVNRFNSIGYAFKFCSLLENNFPFFPLTWRAIRIT